MREMNPRLSVQGVETPSHEHLAAMREHAIDVGFVLSIFLGDTADFELRGLLEARLKAQMRRSIVWRHKIWRLASYIPQE
jgi:hypothetical protein